VDLVVDEQPAAVIGAVLVAAVDVVGIARGVLERAIGLGAHDGFGFVGHAPADHAIDIEHGNTLEGTARRQTQRAHFAAMARADESIVFIELARCHLVTAGCLGGTGCCALGRACVILASRQACSHTGHAQCGALAQKAATCGCGFVSQFLILAVHQKFSLNASMYAVDAEAAPRSSPTPRILGAGNKYKNDMDHDISMRHRKAACHALWQRADFWFCRRAGNGETAAPMKKQPVGCF
jgi:hypothetical protein